MRRLSLHARAGAIVGLSVALWLLIGLAIARLL